MHIQTTVTDIHRYDHLTALEAVALSWSTHGGDRETHRRAQEQVRAAMPELGRALDRLAAER